MPDGDAISWPLSAAPLQPEARAALLERAQDDAGLLGFDPGEYRGWLEDAMGGHPDAGQRRAALACSALDEASLPELIDGLLAVSRARRRDAPTLAGILTQWSEAELRITATVAQARFDDPSSPRNRLAALGKAAGMLGHELRNPIGVIQSSVYLLSRSDSQDAKTRRHVDKIGRQVGNCHRIIEDLMHLARDAPPRLESLDVSTAFLRAVEEAALPATITCLIEVPPGVRVDADAGLLQRALVNLLRNANTAMRGEGQPRLGVTESDGELTLWVRDHGPGFDAQLLREAFDPLSTTSGIGLGLALVESIVRRHAGRATARNVAGGGAEVSLHFPRQTPPAPVH